MTSAMDSVPETMPSDQDLSNQVVELKEAAVLRESELAKLQLEIDAMRQSEKAAEDRMAVFYRDVQKFQQDNVAKPSLQTKSGESSASTAVSSQQQQLLQQVEKYERMLRIMNNQIMLVRSSSDDLVKSLKDKLADAMNEKVQSDLKHSKHVRTLELEKRDLHQSLQKANLVRQATSATRNGNPSQPPQPPRRHKSNEDDDHASTATITMMKEDLRRLRTENQQLKEAAATASETGERKSNHGEGTEVVDSLQQTIQQLTVQNKRLESELSCAPQRPRRHRSIDRDVDVGTIDLLQEDLVRLRSENEQLKQSSGHDPSTDANQRKDDVLDSLNSSVQRLMIENKHLEKELGDQRNRMKENLIQWTTEKANLQNEVDALRGKQSDDSSPQWVEDNRARAMEQLDRVALLWDRADESVQGLESSMNQIRSATEKNTFHSDEVEQVISVQETAILVHGQIKLSLMLIELKLRNNLTCLEFDHNDALDELRHETEGRDHDSVLQTIQSGALIALRELESIAGEQVENLRSKAVHRQYIGDDFSSQFQDSGDFMMEQPASIDMLISHEALETLQNEVLQVVERVKDKNETIDRLSAQVEEHKVRERSLMEELKRHMQDQADRQLAEQQRLMQLQRSDNDNSDGVDGGSFDDGSSEYEEKTVDDAFFCEEVTLYDEETVL